MANNNTNTPIPGSPLIFFFFITLGFLIFTLFSIQSAKSIDSIDKAKDGSMLTIIYVCILIIGSYFINTTISKALCNSQAIRWTDILLATLLPWIIIFFTLFIVLKIFPGWITPFSNTVGYLVISILGVETTLTAILNNNLNVNGDLAKAIANITHNKSNFINQIDINKATFLSFIGDLKDAGIIDLNKQVAQGEVVTPEIRELRGGAPSPPVPGAIGAPPPASSTGTPPPASSTGTPPPARPTATGAVARPTATNDNTTPENNPDITNLYKLLVIKNVLGQITWYTLAGVLVSSVSYNYIINMSCEKSLEEITTDLNNAEAESLEYAQGS
jgi:hypothetical protein|uniref:Uncharacterized protein n=1 Tax=viral metagenome TaxID=1070528 RepID=A0A6C0CBG4_9ZZZZ